jgi:hypothetical protein
MGLQAARDKAFEQFFFAKDVGDAKTAVSWFQSWFDELKKWEAEETFERAFRENRMCVRSAPIDAAAQKKQSFTPQGVRKADDVPIRAGIPHVPHFLKPDNFLQKKKNELGLHDVSAVLLYGDRKISMQVFPKAERQPLFIPIPHEKDLLLFYCIETLAKSDKAGAVYEFYRNARARMTRIKYGSEDDMKTTFLRIAQDKVRYGDAHETAGPVSAEILQKRRTDALFYQSRVLTGKIGDNNEVTLKIRQHAGGWPQAAAPGPLKQSKENPVPYDIPANHFLLIGFDGKFKGLINDDGRLVKA